MNFSMSDEHEGKADELREVLGIVADKVPSLLRGLRDILYSTEAAENMAGAVAVFYKKLVEAGMSESDARDMAREYMVNVRDLMGNKGINLGGLMDRDSEGGRH